MHVLLVTNPRSGTADAVDPASVLVDRGCTVTQASISDAVRWSRDAAPGALGSIERVVVAGGDGSIGCAARLAMQLDVPLGVVPAGTANDFARAMGLPTDHEQATIQAATGDRMREIDLAMLDGTPFVNVASLGIAPHAAEHAAKLKRGMRALAYPLGALIGVVKARPITIAAEVDGKLAWAGKAWQVMLASTGAFGGWAEMETTRDGDGQLDLVVIPADRKSSHLALDAAALVRGDLADREGVFHARGKCIEVTLHRAPRIVVDGELLEIDDRHVVATVEPRIVRVVVG